MKKYSDKFKNIIGSSKGIINDVIDDVSGAFSKNDIKNDVPYKITYLNMDSDNTAIINKINEIIDKINFED